jgi:type III secretion system FlhB-like substrate exporter
MLYFFVHCSVRVEEEIVQCFRFYFEKARQKDLLISEAEVLPLRNVMLNVMLPEELEEVVTMVLRAIYRTGLGRRIS